MDTVVNQLLEVDREARQMLDEAKQYYERTLKELEEEKAKMWASYAERAKQHLDELQSEQQGEIDEVLSQARERTAALIQEMEAHYKERHTRWEDELVSRVIGRDAP